MTVGCIKRSRGRRALPRRCCARTNKLRLMTVGSIKMTVGSIKMGVGQMTVGRINRWAVAVAVDLRATTAADTVDPVEGRRRRVSR
jgi:hypothetical protein